LDDRFAAEAKRTGFVHCMTYDVIKGEVFFIPYTTAKLKRLLSRVTRCEKWPNM
jgi:hypothetical protein